MGSMFAPPHKTRRHQRRNLVMPLLPPPPSLSFFWPLAWAHQSAAPAFRRSPKFSLERVTGVLGTSNRLAGTLGAAGAGLLIAWLGAGSALLANSVVFALSLGLGLRGKSFMSPAIKAGDAGTYFTQMGEGWKVFVADPVLVALVVMLAFTGLFDQAYATVLLPVWVRSSGLDASWVGILLAVFSGAAIFGAAIAAIYAERLPRLTLYIAGFIFAGPVPMAILTLEVPMPVIVGTLLVSGFSAGFLNPIVGALLFERIPKALVGRIVALVGSLTWALIPFGGVYAGLLVENAGIAFALGLTAFLYLVAAMSPTAVPHFRAIGTRSALKPSDAR
jgi:hypothetical protein